MKVCDKTCIFFFFPIINKYVLMAKRSLLSRCPSYVVQIPKPLHGRGAVSELRCCYSCCHSFHRDEYKPHFKKMKALIGLKMAVPRAITIFFCTDRRNSGRNTETSESNIDLRTVDLLLCAKLFATHVTLSSRGW